MTLANNELSFSVEGGATIIGVGNGDPSSAEMDRANIRKAFNGRCLVFLQRFKGTGTDKLTVTGEGVKPASINF